MIEWQDIKTAPRDREIELWNGWAGAYRGRFEDGEWPLRGPQGKFWEGGVWYPVPSKWRELHSPAPSGSEQR